MRLRRNSKKSASPIVPASSEAGGPVDHALKQAVDSRAYAFAYLIKEPSQLPADFPVDEDFQQALFLPQELVPRFEVPRYVPRILVQQSDRVVVYSHPKCGPAKTIIAFVDISHLELEAFLTDCSLTISAAGTAVHLPFHGRDREYVEAFLDDLKHRLLSGGKQAALTSERRNFGSKLDFKFQQIEGLLDIDPETVIARFFVQPEEVIKSSLFRQELSWTFGSEIVLTGSELYLFSDDKDGYRQLYGFRALWAPLQNVTDIRWDDASESVTIRLVGDVCLKVPVPENLRAEAKKFVHFACGQIPAR